MVYSQEAVIVQETEFISEHVFTNHRQMLRGGGLMKIKINLGDNRECETSIICEECNKAFYDNVWRGEEHICKECKEKGKG